MKAVGAVTAWAVPREAMRREAMRRGRRRRVFMRREGVGRCRETVLRFLLP
jgi:hypothetical protein